MIVKVVNATLSVNAGTGAGDIAAVNGGGGYTSWLRDCGELVLVLVLVLVLTGVNIEK